MTGLGDNYDGGWEDAVDEGEGIEDFMLNAPRFDLPRSFTPADRWASGTKIGGTRERDLITDRDDGGSHRIGGGSRSGTHARRSTASPLKLGSRARSARYRSTNAARHSRSAVVACDRLGLPELSAPEPSVPRATPGPQLCASCECAISIESRCGCS